MKRYLLFAYDHYYPNGGAADFLNSFGFDPRTELSNIIRYWQNENRSSYTHCHVWDTETNTITEFEITEDEKGRLELHQQETKGFKEYRGANWTI